jgi:hypothetical protein
MTHDIGALCAEDFRQLVPAGMAEPDPHQNLDDPDQNERTHQKGSAQRPAFQQQNSSYQNCHMQGDTQRTDPSGILDDRTSQLRSGTFSCPGSNRVRGSTHQSGAVSGDQCSQERKSGANRY